MSDEQESATPTTTHYYMYDYYINHVRNREQCRTLINKSIRNPEKAMADTTIEHRRLRLSTRACWSTINDFRLDK